MQTDVVKNIKTISNRIDKCCLQANINSELVSIVAVSKKKSVEYINEALSAGIKDFGENYAQELNEKKQALFSSGIIWHFIGPLQSNKVKVIANCATWIHTLDREKIVLKLNAACKEINKKINGLIQVNVSSEESKSGCDPKEMLGLASIIESSSHINLRGIMALPDINAELTERNLQMNRVNQLSQQLKSKFPNAKEISLGTTNDFEDAIAHGSSMVRIGSSIFGERV
tara:strand:+ start:872 stop:1558 length:687 start_codon:yes stop_codon:yes gene_type:complete